MLRFGLKFIGRGNYLSEEFNSHLKSYVTVWSLMIHYTQRRMESPKCINCTLFEHVRAMLIAANLPKFLWTETLSMQLAQEQNCNMYTRRVNSLWDSPQVQPNLESLPEWGTHVFRLHEGRGKTWGTSRWGGLGQAQPWQPGPSCLLAQKASCHCWKECELWKSCPTWYHAEGWQDIPVNQNQPHPTNCSTSYANTSTCTCPTHRPTTGFLNQTCWCLGMWTMHLLALSIMCVTSIKE